MAIVAVERLGVILVADGEPIALAVESRPLLGATLPGAPDCKKRVTPAISAEAVNAPAANAKTVWIMTTSRKNIAAGQAELRQQAELMGWDADVLKNREAEFISGVHKNIALRLAQSDPIAAKKYADDNKGNLTGPHMTDLEGMFAPMLIDEEAKRKANEFFDGAKVPATRFAAKDLPRDAYSLLGVIAGTESPDYRTINGGAKFSDFSDHPRVKGAGGSSTAAGRYQFVKGTWDRVRGELGLPDFSPESQDRGAWWLAQADYKARTGHDLSDDLAAGRYADVRNGLAPTWEGIAKLTNAQFAPRMSKAGGAAVSADPGRRQRLAGGAFFGLLRVLGVGPARRGCRHRRDRRQDFAPLPQQR